MSEQEIIDGNKIIAKFMKNEAQFKPTEDDYYLNYCKYLSSWDSLMPVIEKIEDLDFNNRVSHTYSIHITGNGTTAYKNLYSGNDNIISRHNVHNRRLYCTWKVIVDFINWHNQNPNEYDN